MPNAYQEAFEALEVRDREQKDVRYKHVATYGFSIPHDDDLAAIVATGATTITEVGAGLGFWASLLAAEGITVTASDIAPPADGTTWSYAFGDTSRSDLDTLKHAVVLPLDAANATATLGGTDTVLAIQPDWPPDWLEKMPAGRLILIEQDSIKQSTGRGGWDWWSAKLLELGFALVTQYDKRLYWPGYEDRLEVWEHAGRLSTRGGPIRTRPRG